MLGQFYVIITDQHSDRHHEFDDEGMQEFVIRQANREGVLYHTELVKIKIVYNIHDGEVKLVDEEEKKDIRSDYSNAFQAKRKLVELAIRRLIKLELLEELYGMNDEGVCEVIRKNHAFDKTTGKICSNTSEIALDMTLVKIIKLGYSNESKGFWWRQIFSGKKVNQTKTQKAIYAAFEEFKIWCANSSQVLDDLKSRNAVLQFRNMIKKYLQP